MYRYQAYGLSIISDLFFPEFIELSTASNFSEASSLDASTKESDEVVICLDKVSQDGLKFYAEKGFSYQFNQTLFWLNIPKVGRYLIEAGQKITIEPVRDVDEDSLRSFILESCLGILLMQRNYFVLQGNATKINDQSIIFLGDYGVGKSSLAAAFLQRGHSILNDGICALSAKFNIIPAYPSLGLWFDTATYLNIDVQPLRKVRPKIDKFILPVDKHFEKQSTPIKSIFILDLYKKDNFSATPLYGAAKLKYLQKYIFQKKYLPALQKSALYFNYCAQIANKFPLILIQRPVKHFRIQELATFIQASGYV